MYYFIIDCLKTETNRTTKQFVHYLHLTIEQAEKKNNFQNLAPVHKPLVSWIFLN